MDGLHREIAATKLLMSNCLTTLTIQRCISDFFVSILSSIDKAIDQAEEISSLCTKVYQEFEDEHGLGQVKPRPLNLGRYRQQVLRLERKHSDFKSTGRLFIREQMSITNRFYDTVGTVTKLIYMKAAKDAADWSKSLMLPLETQVREHHGQLRRRVESVKRIHNAADTVDERLNELELNKAGISDQRDEMLKLSDQVRLCLYSKPGTDHAANELHKSANTSDAPKNQPQNQPDSIATEQKTGAFIVAGVNTIKP